MERKLVFLVVLFLIKLGTSQTQCSLGSFFRFDLTNSVCNICDCTGQNIPCGSPLDSTVVGVIPLQCTSLSTCPNGFIFKDNPTCNCDGLKCAPRATPSPVANGKSASPTTNPVVQCGGNQMYFDDSTGTCQGCACGVLAGSCVDITDNIGSNQLFGPLIINRCPNVASCSNGFIVTDPDKCGCDGIGCKADPNTRTTTSVPNNCGPNDLLAFDETPGYCQACDCTGATNVCAPVSNSIASSQLAASILAQCPVLTSCPNGWTVLFPNKCSCDGLGCNAPEPTSSPTAADEPTASPTMYIEPTVSPTAVNTPTESPSVKPSYNPTESPTISPTPVTRAGCAPGDLFEFIDERPNGECKVCGCGALAIYCENALLLPSDPQFSQFAKQQCTNIANCPGEAEIVDDTTCSCDALGCKAADPTTSPAMDPTTSPVMEPTSSPVEEPTASPTDATNPCINSPPKFEETNNGKCKICLCDETSGDYDCTNPLSSNSAISTKEFMDFCSISGNADTCQLTREGNSCDCDDFKCETRICQDEFRYTKSGKKFECKCQPNGNKICRPFGVTPSPKPTSSPTMDDPSEKEAIVLLFNAVFEYNMFDFELQATIFQLAATAITTSRILAGLAGINLKFAIPEFEYVCKTDQTFRQLITYGNVNATSFDICDLGSILCLDGYIEIEGRVAIIFDSDDYSSKDIIETAFDAGEFFYNEFSDDIGTFCDQISQCGCGDFYLNSAAILVTEDNCVLTFDSNGLDQTPSNTCPYDILNNVSKAVNSFNINYTFISIFISLMIIVQIY